MGGCAWEHGEHGQELGTLLPISFSDPVTSGWDADGARDEGESFIVLSYLLFSLLSISTGRTLNTQVREC